LRTFQLIFVLAGSIGCAATSWAQIYPANGYIGVFEDEFGSDCCINTVPGSPITFYIFARLAGAAQNGITGAEFRVEIPCLSGMFVTASPNPESNINLGNPLDDPGVNTDPGGVNQAYPTCQGAASGFVRLYTVSGFNASVTSTSMTVKARRVPSNPEKNCPLFVLCDAPTFTAVCLTLTREQNGGVDPISFNSSIQPVGASCPYSECRLAGPDPCPLGTEPSTWTGVKGMYR